MFFMTLIQFESKSDLSGVFPSSDKQPYLKVPAHLNLSLRAHLLVFRSFCSD